MVVHRWRAWECNRAWGGALCTYGIGVGVEVGICQVVKKCGAQVFEVVTKLVVASKSATAEVDTNRQRLGKQLEALLHKVGIITASYRN